MQKITPFLWFNNNAEEAVNFYISVFKNGKILKINRYSEGGPMPAGTVMVVEFEVNEQAFIALNGGPHFKFTEAISFVVKCEDQSEIDEYWQVLSAGGSQGQCGWLKDKFGLSWQIVPVNIGELVRTPAAVQAMMKMGKLDIEALKAAGK